MADTVYPTGFMTLSPDVGFVQVGTDFVLQVRFRPGEAIVAQCQKYALKLEVRLKRKAVQTWMREAWSELQAIRVPRMAAGSSLSLSKCSSPIRLCLSFSPYGHNLRLGA
jgi:hypothetical protein